MQRKSFIQGAAVLAVAGLFVKVLGAIFKIPLGDMIGADGISYFLPAYYVYNFFLILATAGIPVAISKLVSERYAFGQYGEAHKTFQVSRYLVLSIGSISFLIVFFCADTFAEWFQLPESALAMRCIAPALFFVPLMSSYRGYFQGMQDMRPTAFSQVVEQIFRVLVGLYLAYGLFHGTVSLFAGISLSAEAKGAAGGTLGAAAGAVAGLAVVLAISLYKRTQLKQRRDQETRDSRISRKTILKQILIIAVPITIGAAIMPIVNLVDAAVVNRRLLTCGFDAATARTLYGGLGFASSLVNFPQVLTQAVAMSMVPVIAAAYKAKNWGYLNQNVSTGLRISFILGFPCTLGLMIFAQPILLLLYPSQESDALIAAPCLSVLACGVLFLSIVQTSTGILQGVGKQMTPVRNLFIGVLVKIVLTWVLTGIPAINVKGSAAGTVAAYIIASVLNLWAVKKYTGTKLDLMAVVVKPFGSTAVMGLCAWSVYVALEKLTGGSRISVIGAILVAILVYAALLLLTKTVTREELSKRSSRKEP